MVAWLLEHPNKAIEPSGARHAPQWVQEFDPAVLDPLLPPAPMCFDARDRWLDYVAASRKDHSIVREAGGGLTLNPAWSWCEDCLPEFRAPMVRAGRCHPPAAETSRRISAAVIKTAQP